MRCDEEKTMAAALMTLVLMLTTSLPALQRIPLRRRLRPPAKCPMCRWRTRRRRHARPPWPTGAADSISWAVWEEGEITTSGSLHGQRDAAQASAGAVYGIGSVSKIFTTTAVMQLVDQHRISLDAPVTQYLPEFRMQIPLPADYRADAAQPIPPG